LNGPLERRKRTQWLLGLFIGDEMLKSYMGDSDKNAFKDIEGSLPINPIN